MLKFLVKEPLPVLFTETLVRSELKGAPTLLTTPWPTPGYKEVKAHPCAVRSAALAGRGPRGTP